MKRGDLLLFIAVLAVFGAVDGLYLAYQWYAGASAGFCEISNYFSCGKVRESIYSHVGPFPTALVGAVGFLLLVALAVWALRGRQSLGPWTLDRWILVFAIIGALVGLALTFIEIFLIQAVCILCALGFGLDLVILVLAVLLPRAE